nr:MAG: hypothetical protein [Bacteriophage sp.]
MDVDAMDELMYDTLIRYFKTLAHTGYKSYDVVFKMLVMDFIYEITHTELRYYITNKDIKLMQDLLYQLFGSTCEISFPTNNRPCCVCVCCNGEGTTPPPVVVPTTTTTSTQPPIEPTYLVLSSTVANTAYVDYELVEMWTPIKVEVGSKVTIMAQSVSGYTFKGFYVAGSLISSSNALQYTIPSTGTNTIELRYEEEEESTTTTTSSTSTQPPAKTSTIVFKHDPRTAYTVTYSGSNRLTVSDLEHGEIKLKLPVPLDSVHFAINSIVCANSNYECNEVVAEGNLSYHLPCQFVVVANQHITVTPVITDSVPTTTTTTTTSSTTTSTPSPVGGNNVYYGVVEDYMPPLDFVGTPIDTLMKRGGTKSKAITGTNVNEFAIPQNGYYTYLIVPVNKVELKYAAFTSGGITTVCYDSTKENIPNDTNNGIFFSKYTRGGVNANKGGAYNGINYDVYFVYNNYGGAPELINVKAKNK